MQATEAVSLTFDRLALNRRFKNIKELASRRIGKGSLPESNHTCFGACLAGSDAIGGAVAKVPFASLPALLGDAGLVLIKELIADCEQGWRWQSDALSPQDVAVAAPQLYLLGLAPGMIARAEAYLEEPCLYVGATLKVERVAPSGGTRLWHRDVEDQRMLRVLIYLNEVTENGGPLEVLPPELSRKAVTALRYRSGLIEDERMAAVVPPSNWVKCVGRAGDALLFDGARHLHRSKPPVVRERYSLTFTYMTQSPIQIKRGSRLLCRTQQELLRQLSLDQRTHLPNARWF